MSDTEDNNSNNSEKEEEDEEENSIPATGAISARPGEKAHSNNSTTNQDDDETSGVTTKNDRPPPPPPPQTVLDDEDSAEDSKPPTKRDSKYGQTSTSGTEQSQDRQSNRRAPSRPMATCEADSATDKSGDRSAVRQASSKPTKQSSRSSGRDKSDKRRQSSKRVPSKKSKNSKKKISSRNLSKKSSSHAGSSKKSSSQTGSRIDSKVPTNSKRDISDDGIDKSSSSKLHKKQKRKVDLAAAKVGFVGAGKMTEALVRGLITYAKISHRKIFVSAKSFRNLDCFHSKGVTVSKRPYDIFGQFDCDIIFLAIHGYVIRACFKGGGTRPFAFTTNYIPNQKHPIYVLSLIGGVPLSDVRVTMLDPENPDKYMIEMHRIMVNIGVAYGFGLGAIDVDPDSKQCSPIIRDILSSITKLLEYFPQAMMDALCVIGGNGLAFCYYFISALADGGFKMGLNKGMAIKLACKALQSAAQCLLESSKHPSELQDSVISSAGPAIYGIHVMDKADCSSGIQAAIDGSYRRLRQLVDIQPILEIEARPHI